MNTLSIHTVYDTKVNGVRRNLIRREVITLNQSDTLEFQNQVAKVLELLVLPDETVIEYSYHDCLLDCNDPVCNLRSGLEVK